MLTPETTAKTEGPLLGASSILGINDSLLNNNTSITKKNNFLSTERPIKKLSNYISLESKNLFLERNKSALQDYEKFLKITKNNTVKSKNSKNNFLEHYYKYPYKDNPKLIIGSYNTKILGNNDISLNKKYKVDIIGVDEGYIHLPTSHNNEFSKILNIKDSINLEHDKNIKEDLTIPKIKNYKNKSVLKLNNNKINFSHELLKKKLNKKKHKVNLALLDKGEEFISKIGLVQDENGQLNKNKNNLEKIKENFEEQNNFIYEIKKLENWDFEHCQKDALKKYLSKENISNILKKPENSQMKWYLDMKNDKKQLKLMNRNKHLKEFFMKIEEEQKAIFLQSFSVNKKAFNFDIFENDINEVGLDKKEEKIQIRQIQFYKDVMKEKFKIEEMFHNELTNCAEEVHFTRIKKKKTMIKLFEISQKKNEVYKEEQNIKKIFQRNMGKMNEYNDVLSILSKVALEKEKQKNKNKNKNDSNEKSKSPKREKKNSPMKKISSKISAKILNAIHLENITNENKKKAFKRSSLIVNNVFLEKEKKPKQKFNLEKLDLTAFNEKADLFQLQSDLIAQKNEIQNEYNKNMVKIAETKNDLDFKFKQTKLEIQNLNAYFRKAKSNLDLRIQTLSGYYYQILKQGIDVRKNGLTWVVVKLMELNSYIDKHYFPSFLDEEQISYILRVGVKIHELNELIKLFQILKEKQKILRDKHIEAEVKKEKEIQNKNFINLIKNSNNKIGNNYTKYIEDIQVKYENVINICLNENREEANINKIKDELKEQILKSKYDDELELLNEPELYFIPGTLAEFFKKDKRFRLYFDDVYYLNDEINKRKKNILEEKKNELSIFRNKYNLDDISIKTKDKIGNKITNSIKNEQIYAALFGNGISL